MKELGECQLALAQAHLDLHKESCPKLTLEMWGDMLGNGGLEAIIKVGKILILQAVVARCVVGYVSCEVRPRGIADDSRPHAKINHLTVLESHRQKGIGHLLLEELAAVLKQKFPKCLSLVKLVVAAKNSGAMRLYDACGFKEVDAYTSVKLKDTPDECSIKWRKLECESGLQFKPRPPKPVCERVSGVTEPGLPAGQRLQAQEETAAAPERKRRIAEEKEEALRRSAHTLRPKAEEQESEEGCRSRKKPRTQVHEEASAKEAANFGGRAQSKLPSSKSAGQRPVASKVETKTTPRQAYKTKGNKEPTRASRTNTAKQKDAKRSSAKKRASPTKQHVSAITAGASKRGRVDVKAQPKRKAAKDKRGQAKPKASAKGSRR